MPGSHRKVATTKTEIEVHRIHAVLHPECFGTLVAAFNYRPPEERIELPRFYSHQSDDESPPRQRRAPAELSAEDLAEINHMLGEQAARRRRASPTVIRVIVDGVERGTLNPAEQSSISFSASEDAETIELKTTDASGDLLLATHLITFAAEGTHERALVSSIRLEGGQELSLSITRRSSEAGGASGAAGLLIKFGYQETDPRRATRLWWQRLRLRLSMDQLQPSSPIVVVGVVVICLASYLGYLRLKSQSPDGPPPASNAQTTPLPQNSEALVAKADDRTSKPEPTPTQPARPAPHRSVRAEEGAIDATRTGVVIPNLKLSEVKKIFIDVRGDATFDELRRNLIASLGVAATTNVDEADASLKIVASQASTSARLVNARGRRALGAPLFRRDDESR